ncbi:MAG: hypothetical protein WCK00_14280, partial [Deltaproteobacteria bacterium]
VPLYLPANYSIEFLQVILFSLRLRLREGAFKCELAEAKPEPKTGVVGLFWRRHSLPFFPMKSNHRQFYLLGIP